MSPPEVNFSSVVFAVGSPERLARLPELPALDVFSEASLDFLEALSKTLLRKNAGHSDAAAFGFWCRRSALLRRKPSYRESGPRFGRGLVFHSTPSNVPVNFAFSFAAGLLAGNANIVRLPAKKFPQVEIIARAVDDLLALEAHAALASYVVMLRYEPSRELNDYFSRLCDARIVWGGDETIGRMRQSPLPPRATELTFADRYSLAVVQADGYLDRPDKDDLARNFYNDTYVSDQNACTAPRLVVWLGERKEEAKKLFWDLLRERARRDYPLTPAQAVGKLGALCRLAARRRVAAAPETDQVLTRVAVGSLDAELMRFAYHSGFFLEYDAETLDDILPLCGQQCQTLVYCGLEPAVLAAFIARHKPRGVDRIVPVGRSMDFSLIWDGYDLIAALSRAVGLS